MAQGMRKVRIVGALGAAAALVAAAVLLAVRAVPGPWSAPAPLAGPPPAADPSTPAEVYAGFLYGRITDVDETVFEGRLRWGGDEEAFWSDYFNGARDGNPWAAHMPGAAAPFEVFGFRIGGGDDALARPFMARFGDIARIEARLRHVLVTLKSGALITLDRFAAGDIDDGVRVWDVRRGVVDLDARRIRTIELMPAAPLAGVPDRLYGTVHTGHGDFTGFIQWDWHDCTATDELSARADGGEVSLPFGNIRAIARRSRESALVTLRDGRELVLSGTREVGRGHSGVAVDDPRYGRVVIGWVTFERVEFSPRDSGPGYGDFPKGRPLAGTVVTRDGRRLDGRLVYDFDESETTETLDVSSQGVEYFIPFERVASIALGGRDTPGAGPARVTLRDGSALTLERAGDLGDRNAGMLIFRDGRERPEFVPWTSVEQIDFEAATGDGSPQ